MKKTSLTSISVFALLFLASCTTDNMPTEANESNYQNNSQQTKSINTEIRAASSVSKDSVRADIQILNSSSKTLENGDLGTLKDKTK